MRLISFSHGSRRSWGIIDDNGVIDLGARLPEFPSLRRALASLSIDQIRDRSEGCETDIDPSTIRFDPVIPDARQILCIGLNYDEHRVESRRERTGHPTVFARFAASQTGHMEAILCPHESQMLDYEGEVALIIGRAGRRIREEEALSFVAGYACYNDASLRDFQRHTSQFHPGKNFPATGAFGPWMVTADEIPDPQSLFLQTTLNGQVVQSASLDQLIFTIPELIAYCSIFTELLPGDVIVTGTPGGVGAGRTPPLWMKPEDTVSVTVDGIGTLTNTIVGEDIVTGV
ncbi:fumarylacetoacetate hydrolase family protein [Sphingomonas profundi]|uniref:fumarylacetoacetate hydrolase family protein n=1 Tax=Alterirhizorhabdus profundi TaxID=2681549 RepID=UPI0012E982B4|nr:fumarylacetoacetate hydrolase family protein [Sphingomonas profundi]